MNSTPDSLFDRLKCAKPDDRDWKRLHDLYDPLIRRWLKKLDAHESDIDDLAQEILTTIARAIANFIPQRDGSFRKWLLIVCKQRVSACCRKRERGPRIDFDRSQMLLEQLVDPESATTRSFNSIYDKDILAKLLEIIKPDFRESTWRAFVRNVFDRIPIPQVAEELNVSENAVILAKKRVMKRLREEGGHFLS